MRKKRLLINTIMALINQIVSLVCGFILPRQILIYYGSSMNGLVTSITQFLGFISIMDMGVGAVVQSSLYKPLAENDVQAISEIIASAKRFFRRIAVVLVGYTVVLAIAFPLYIEPSYGNLSTSFLVISVSLSSIAQYYFGLTNQLLLNADQKSYVHLSAQCIATILNTIICITLIYLGKTIYSVKFWAAIALMTRPILLSIYVNRNYAIDRTVVLRGEPIKQKWNGLAQHLATFVADRTDVAVLTIMSTLTNVSIYYIYHLVVTSLYQLFVVLTSGIQSLLGDMYAKREAEQLSKTFALLEWSAHLVVTLLFGCTIVLILPFVSVYTKGVTDAEYLQPLFGVLIVSAFACYCLRGFYHLPIKAAGHYRETQVSAVIEALLNVLVSVAMVSRFGLVGVAIGTLLSAAYRLFYFAAYLKKSILHMPFMRFLKYMLMDIFSITLLCFATRSFVLASASYGAWMILGIKVFFVALLIIVPVNCIACLDQIKEVIKRYFCRKKDA